jgi:hypothetical protein
VAAAITQEGIDVLVILNALRAFLGKRSAPRSWDRQSSLPRIYRAVAWLSGSPWQETHRPTSDRFFTMAWIHAPIL